MVEEEGKEHPWPLNIAGRLRVSAAHSLLVCVVGGRRCWSVLV